MEKKGETGAAGGHGILSGKAKEQERIGSSEVTSFLGYGTCKSGKERGKALS